jgi:hypothetical protein
MPLGPIAIEGTQPVVNTIDTDEDYTTAQNDGIIIARAALTLTLGANPLTGSPLIVIADGGDILVNGPIQLGPITVPQGTLQAFSFSQFSETWSVIASGTPGLAATYYEDNGQTDIAVGNTGGTVLVTVPGVTITKPNQKIIIHATVWYTATAGDDGTLSTGVFVSQPPGPFVPVDATADSSTPGANHTVTRVFEITMAAPGIYTVQLQGTCQGGLTSAEVFGAAPGGSGITPSARVTVEVVNV